MFIDEALIHVKAGDGGHGCVSFRREKYVPKGGPDGGDGGDGGSIIFVADANKGTLLDFAGRHHWKAKRGMGGMGKKMAGLSGEDLVISVPVGTLVYDSEHQHFAGRSGYSRKNASSSPAAARAAGATGISAAPSNQAPRYAESGTEGQERRSAWN